MKIYKYFLDVIDYQSFELPKGAKILSFQTQSNMPCIWVLLDPDAESETRQFRLAGTGHDIDNPIEKLEFIGTVQCAHLVWHLFEVKE